MAQIKLIEKITSKMVDGNPSVLFLFGDNMQRHGTGGQASYGRNRKNAVGVPTRWKSTSDQLAYFKDSDWYKVVSTIDRDLDRIESHLRAGGNVVFPTNGIGTGLAELPKRAPKIFTHIENRLKGMMTTYGVDGGKVKATNPKRRKNSEESASISVGIVAEPWEKANNIGKLIGKVDQFVDTLKNFKNITLLGVGTSSDLLDQLKDYLSKKLKGVTISTQTRENDGDVIDQSNIQLFVVNNEGKIDESSMPRMFKSQQGKKWKSNAIIFLVKAKGEKLLDNYIATVDSGKELWENDDFVANPKAKPTSKTSRTKTTKTTKTTQTTTTQSSSSTPNLNSMSVAQLRAEAKRQGLSSYSKLSKPALIALLSGGSTQSTSSTKTDQVNYPTFTEFYEEYWGENAIDINSMDPLYIRSVLGIELGAIDDATYKKAINSLSQTKVPLPDDFDPVAFIRFPTYIHTSTPLPELQEMAKRIYDINPETVKGKVESDLRNFALRFFPSPSFWSTLPLASIEEKAEVLGTLSLSLFPQTKYTNSEDQLREHINERSGMVEDLSLMYGVPTPTVGNVNVAPTSTSKQKVEVSTLSPAEKKQYKQEEGKERKAKRVTDKTSFKTQKGTTQGSQTRVISSKPEMKLTQTEDIDLSSLEELRATYECEEQPKPLYRGKLLGNVASIYSDMDDLENLFDQDSDILSAGYIEEFARYVRQGLNIQVLLSSLENPFDKVLQSFQRNASVTPQKSDQRPHKDIGIHFIYSNELLESGNFFQVVDLKALDMSISKDREWRGNWGDENQSFAPATEEGTALQLASNSGLCIAIFPSEESLSDFLQVDLAELVGDIEDATPFQRYLITALLCKKQIIAFNEGGDYEYFDGLHDRYFHYSELKDFIDGTPSKELEEILEKMADGSLSTSQKPTQVTRDLQSSNRTQTFLEQQEDEEDSDEPYGEFKNIFMQRQASQIADRDAKKGGRPKKVEKTEIPVSLPKSPDIFLRSPNYFSPRLVIIPVWDYRDISLYVSSYAKNLSDYELRKSLKSFMSAWADNRGTYLGYSWSKIIETSRSVCEEYDFDAEKVAPFASIVAPKTIVSVDDSTEMCVFIQAFNSPSGAESVPTSLSKFQTGGNNFLRATPEEDITFALPYHEFGSAILVQDILSGDDNADPGLNLLFVYMGDVDIHMNVSERRAKDSEGKKVEWYTPYLTTEPAEGEDNEDYAEGHLDTLVTNINIAIGYLKYFYKSILETPLANLAVGFDAKGEADLLPGEDETSLRIVIPENALSPKNTEMLDGYLWERVPIGDDHYVLDYLSQYNIPYEVLPDDYFEYSARIADTPLVTELEGVRSHGLQGSSSKLYLIDTNPSLFRDDFISDLTNNSSFASYHSQAVHTQGDPLLDAIYRGIDALGGQQLAYFDPSPAAVLSQEYLEAEFLTWLDPKNKSTESFSILDYLLDSDKYGKCQVTINTTDDDGNEIKKIESRSTLDVIKIYLTKHNVGFAVGVGSPKPQLEKRRNYKNEIVEYQGKMFLDTFLITSEENELLTQEEVNIDDEDITILLPASIRDVIWTNRRRTAEDNFIVSSTNHDNYPLNDTKVFLTRRLLSDETPSKVGFNSYPLQFPRFKIQGGSELKSVYSTRFAPIVIDAPILPLVNYDPPIYGDQNLKRPNLDQTIASQYVYENLERRMREFLKGLDQTYATPVIVFNYQDFERYKYYRRVDKNGRESIFLGIEALLRTIEIVLSYNGVRAVVFNLPEDSLTGVNMELKEKLAAQEIDFSKAQLGSNVSRKIKPLEPIDNEIACLWGVIGNGNGSAYTFTVGDFPKFMLDPAETFKKGLEDFVSKKKMTETEAKSTDFDYSEFASYFTTRNYNPDDTNSWETNLKGFNLNPGTEIEIEGVKLNPRDILKGVMPTMQTYEMIEDIVLNNMDILKNLPLLESTSKGLRVRNFDKNPEEYPFQAPLRDWNVYNEEFKTYNRLKLELQKEISQTLDQADPNYHPIQREIGLFEMGCDRYLSLFTNLEKVYGKYTAAGKPFRLSDKQRNEFLFNIKSMWAVQSPNEYGDYDAYFMPFAMMNIIDGQILSEGDDVTKMDLIPFKIQSSYYNKKGEFLSDIINAVNGIARKYGKQLRTDDLFDSFSHISSWAELAQNENEQDSANLDRKVATIEKIIRQRSGRVDDSFSVSEQETYEAMVEDSIVRALERRIAPEPPPGREPRLTLFAIREDGSCFKITKTNSLKRGGLKIVNEYPFYVANDAFNPMNLQLGALLRPPRSGTLLEDIATAAFGYDHPIVQGFKDGSRKENEAASIQLLSGALTFQAKRMRQGSSERTQREQGAELIRSGDKGQKISTALGYFGNRFSHLFPEDYKDFYRNTPSLKRYLNSLLREKMNIVTDGFDHEVVVDVKDKENHEIIEADVQDRQEIKNFLELPWEDRRNLSYYFAVSNVVENGFSSEPEMGPALRLIRERDGEVEIENLPLRQYEYRQYNFAVDMRDLVKSWLASTLDQKFDAFYQCIILPGLREMKGNYSGELLLAKAKSTLSSRYELAQEERERRIAAQAMETKTTDAKVDDRTTNLITGIFNIYEKLGNVNTLKKQHFLGLRLRLSALDFLLRGKSTSEGSLEYFSLTDAGEVRSVKEQYFIPNWTKFKTEVCSTEFTLSSDLSLAMTNLFRNYSRFTNGIIKSLPANANNIVDVVPEINGELKSTDKMLEALDEIIYAYTQRSADSEIKTWGRDFSLINGENSIGFYHSLVMNYLKGGGEWYSMLDYINANQDIPDVSDRYLTGVKNDVLQDIERLNKVLASFLRGLFAVYEEIIFEQGKN